MDSERKTIIKDSLELVGIFAVLLGLAFVGYELRQNTASVQAATSQGLMEQNNQFNIEMATDRDLAELIFKGNAGIGDLNSIERLQYRSYMTARFNVWEQAYYAFAAGTLSDKLWHDYDAGGSRRVCQHSPREVWREVEYFFGVDFRTYVNDGIKTSCDGTE